MKNLKYAIILTAFVLGISTFQSCYNDSDLIDQNEQLQDKIGFYHNLILERNLSAVNKETSVMEIRELIMNTLSQESSSLFNQEVLSSIVIPSKILEQTNLRSKKSTAESYGLYTSF